MNLPDNILRSGVPHAVETNLVTRHAINPRHTFLDTEPPTEAGDSDPSGDLPRHGKGELDEVAPTVPSEHLRDNVQALDKHGHTDNWQSLGQEHWHDNRQAAEGTVFKDNHQSLGPTPAIQEKKLYLEKKSIKDLRLKVAQRNTARSAPELREAHTATLPASAAVSGVALRKGADKKQTSAALSNAKQQEDDALRARMKKLKATVRDVNDTLSDLDPQP